MALPRLLNEFCLTTSMKGVPRIMRSQTAFLRTMWSISVLLFLSVSITGAYFLITEYFRYPKITTITEKAMNVTEPLLPDIMVCNINPIASGYSQVDRAPSIQEYNQLIINMTACEGCSTEERQKMETIEEELLTTQGYYQYIGRESAQKIGHQLEHFLVKCHVLALEGPSLRRRPCVPFVTIAQLVTPEYFNCYIFKISHKQPGVHLYGLSLILYLDNFLDYEMPYFNTLTDSGQATGVKVLVYEANTLPMFMSEAFDLSPGMYSTIHLKGERRQRLPQPWGNCADKNQLTETFLGFPIEYTAEGCFVLCTERNITETCKCKDEWFTGYQDEIYYDKYENTPYCMEVTKGLPHIINKLECLRNIRNVAFRQCLSRCLLPCHDMIYHTYISQSKWPSKIQHKAFYDSHIKGKSFSSHFPSPYMDKNNVSSNRWSVSDNLSQAIYDNFIKMNVYFGDYRVIHLEQMPKVSLSQLMSQLGGTLNLWSGITVILLVEILDLLYQVCTGIGHKETEPGTEEAKPVQGVEDHTLRKKRDDP